MPATATHAFFAKDVYDILPGDIKKNLSISRSKMFAQSTDSLMFYNCRISQILSLALFIVFSIILIYNKNKSKHMSKIVE